MFSRQLLGFEQRINIKKCDVADSWQKKKKDHDHELSNVTTFWNTCTAIRKLNRQFDFKMLHDAPPTCHHHCPQPIRAENRGRTCTLIGLFKKSVCPTAPFKCKGSCLGCLVLSFKSFDWRAINYVDSVYFLKVSLKIYPLLSPSLYWSVVHFKVYVNARHYKT